MSMHEYAWSCGSMHAHARANKLKSEVNPFFNIHTLLRVYHFQRQTMEMHMQLHSKLVSSVILIYECLIESPQKDYIKFDKNDSKKVVKAVFFGF